VPEHASALQLKAAMTRAYNLANNLTQHKITKLTQQTQILDLGWRQLSELPTIFAKTVVQLQRHEYSAPLRAANGWHIIYLNDWYYLPTQTFNTMSAATAEELIFHRKFDQAVKEWLEKLRHQSFIMIKDHHLT
jgi:parvulin-like peptidyl-prolyl isomerase